MTNIVALRKPAIVDNVSLWNAASTGDWATDCRIGRDHADRLVEHYRRSPDDLPRFVYAMEDMVKKGNFTGVETGFFTALMEAVITQRTDATSPAHESRHTGQPSDPHNHLLRGI